jgi:hypothetical protein
MANPNVLKIELTPEARRDLTFIAKQLDAEGDDGVAIGSAIGTEAVLLEAIGWFDMLADHIPRAKENRHSGNGALRMRAAEFLPGVFRKRLGRPYHENAETLP